jgi:hypothetical protein
MHQRLALLAIFLFSSFASFAQDVEKNNTDSKNGISKPSRDFVMLQFNYEGWTNQPDSVKTIGFGRGFNAYICYDWPLGKSNFSFAAGIGIGTANIYMDNQEIVLTDTGANGAQARFIPETENYKKFKLTTAYLEAPFELRFFGNKDNRNKGFKAAVGLRVGTLLGAHTKSRRDVEGVKIVEKVNTKRYLENWRFAGTVRMGWGNFTLMGTYNLTNLFKAGMGPEVTPYSIGLCITGL